MKGPRFNVLGVAVSALNLEQTVASMGEAIGAGSKGYICITGVHGVSEAQEDEGFRRILNDAFLVTADGMPLVWLGKLFGHREIGRVYGPDLMNAFFAWSESYACRHFLLGGGEGVAEELKRALLARFPKATICGCYTPPFRPLNDVEIAALAKGFAGLKPDITWVGLSTPKQEKFMREFLPRLETTLMVGVGAAFDFHAGKVRQAPKWVQRSGFEWLFRLIQEPRRLWRRYLKNNPLFLWRVALQLTGLREYRLDAR